MGSSEHLTLAYWARYSRHVTLRWNLPDLVNFPKHVPAEVRCFLGKLAARRISRAGR